MRDFFRFCSAAPRIRTLHTRCQTWREIWANGTVASRLKSAEPCLKMAVSTGFCRTYSTVHKWRPLRVHFKFYVLFSPQTLNVESEVELCSRGNRCCEKAYIYVYISVGRLSSSLTQIFRHFHRRSWWRRPPTWLLTWSSLTANILDR